MTRARWTRRKEAVVSPFSVIWLIPPLGELYDIGWKKNILVISHFFDNKVFMYKRNSIEAFDLNNIQRKNLTLLMVHKSIKPIILGSGIQFE